jgi:hypothetical protein
MFSVLLWVLPHRHAPRAGAWLVVAVCLAVAGAWERDAAAADTKEASLGVAIVPQDAAFVSSTLRLRDQYDRLMASRAVAAIKELPAVKRAIESYEESRTTPGSPFSTFDAFLQMPENADAAELLADMVSTDTFLYGEPSCASFWRLVRKLAESQQRAGFAAESEESGESGEDVIVEEEDMDEEDDDAKEEDDADADEDEEEESDEEDDDAMELDLQIDGGVDADRQARAVFKALAENLDLIVVPDIVWGFKTTKRAIAIEQLARIETLGTMLLQSEPDARKSLSRRQVAGGEMLVYTLDGDTFPWDDLPMELEGVEGADEVIERFKSLDVVIAVGVVGDWVILSIGDSVDHLEKLALPGSGRKGLLTLPAFRPLIEHLDKPITGVAYVSESFNEAISASRSDLDSMLKALDDLEGMDELPDDASQEVRDLARKGIDEWAKLLPEPGPWMSFSFMSEQGYEGYAWDWSRNQPFDGSKRLDLFEHVGGAPLAVVVSRMKSDPKAFDALTDLGGSAWTLFRKYGRPSLDDEEGTKFDEFEEHIAPLAGRFLGIFRDKIRASIADGQVGLVLDAKARTKKLQAELPGSAEPLPVVEPAIVLPLADAKLFREGLSDLFALGDELTEAIRDMDPDAVPEGYRIPEPEKTKVEDGTVWSWKLAGARLDDQIRPSIGLGEKAVVFSFVPKQAGRMLPESRLETGSQLTRFAEPLAAGAALDFAGLVDVLGPWVTYVTRYGCVQIRDGAVDPDTELSAADETDEAKEVLAQVKVVLEALKSLRAAVVETSQRDDALVTHWRNVIRDMPAK